MDPKATFTLREISEATGIELKELQARFKRLVRDGEIEQSKKGTLRLYSYGEVKLLVKPKRNPYTPRPNMVLMLRQQLKTDGLPCQTKPKEVVQ